MANTKEALAAAKRKGAAKAKLDKLKLQATKPVITQTISTDERREKLLRIGAVLQKMHQGTIDGLPVSKTSFKAMTTTTDTAGGFVVAEDFANFVAEKRANFNSVSNIVNRIPTSTDTLKVPVENGLPTVQKTAQGSAITPSDATFTQLNVAIHDNLVLVPIQNQLVNDWSASPGAVEYVISKVAVALNNQEELEIMAGTGSNQATGLSDMVKKTGGFTNQVADGGTTPGTFSADSLLNLYHALSPQYRANAVFVMRDQAAKNLYSFGTNTINSYFTPVSVTGATVPGQIGTFMGRPVVTNERISLTFDLNGVVANKASVVYFGDFSNYILGENTALDIATSADAGFNSNQTMVRGVKRFGGGIAQQEAFAILAYRGTA